MSLMTPERALEVMDLHPGATREEVKKAFKILVRKWHPDQFGHAPGLQKMAEDKLKEINAAYTLLKSQAASAPSPAGGSAKGSPGGVPSRTPFGAVGAFFLTLFREILNLGTKAGSVGGTPSRPADFETILKAAEQRCGQRRGRPPRPPGRGPGPRRAGRAQAKGVPRRPIRRPFGSGGRGDGGARVEEVTPVRRVGAVRGIGGRRRGG